MIVTHLECADCRKTYEASKLHNLCTECGKTLLLLDDFPILDALRESGGAAIAVSDKDLIAAVKEIGAAESLFCAPEGAACPPALRSIIERNLVKEYETVVLLNAGAGVKYLECFQ